MEVASAPSPYKQLVEKHLYFTPTTSFMTALSGAVGKGFRIARGEQALASLRKTGWFSDIGMELCLPARRLRFDRPDDHSFAEGWSFFKMPRRRMVWRAGYGVAAEVRETSATWKRLTGGFEVDGHRYNVRCDWDGGSGHNYHRQLIDATGTLAELEVNQASSGLVFKEFVIWMHRPVRLDALAIAVHTMFWLQESARRGSGGGAGGGGGGGGC